MFAWRRRARTRGYDPGRFSFNVKGGRCEACQGDGVVKVEMHFLADVYVPCEVCQGRRYNQQTLAVRYKGHTIADVLELSIDECAELFTHHKKLARILTTLQDVGLGYMKIGQTATTMSGGEAQRVKLSRELGKVQTGRTLYVLDEPTTGLHLADVEQLLGLLDRLVDSGKSVIVIEHDLDVVAEADWVIDLGPEGGADGGRVQERLARNLVVSIGGTPNIPEAFRALRGDGRVFHSNSYLRNIARLGQPQRVAVIGAGQSAAEIFMDLQARPHAPQVDLVMRARAIRPSDDSPFVNEVFNVDFTDYVFSRASEERAALLDAEPMLLVRHDESETAEEHIVLDQRVSAYDNVDEPHLQTRKNVSSLASRQAARQQSHLQSGSFIEPLQRFRMLLRQYFRRHHKRALMPRLDGSVQSNSRHHGFARTDIALYETIHAVAPAHIRQYFVNDLLLRVGQRERELAMEGPDQEVLALEGDPPALGDGAVRRATSPDHASSGSSSSSSSSSSG